jgi:myo-inositol-1(or 4)-monophosphatase
MADETCEVLALAVRLAREAGGVQRSRYETVLSIASKRTATDLVTEVDKACEALIVQTLASQRPSDAVLAEEGGGEDRPGARWRWIIDPLDGTTNYAHGYPRFCVSIGVERDGVRQVGVVYDPLLDELFQAARGEGAQRNGSPIHVSKRAELGHALLATGFPYDVRTSPEDNLPQFAAFAKRARALRRDGSAALDLCYVACGRLDGYWELKLKAWDVSAGALIVEEAGGRCTGVRGQELPRDGSEVVASNGLIHAEMLETLRASEAGGG